MKKYAFDKKEPFLNKLTGIVQTGVSKETISVVTPYHVHEVDEILELPPSKLRFFALIGAVAGTLSGFAFTIYTALDWPINTSGKPLIAIPPFIIIAFALTILFGSLISFAGFLILSRLPSLHGIMTEEEYGNKFVILIDKEE